MINLSSNDSLNEFEEKNEIIKESIHRVLLYNDDEEEENEKTVTCKWPFTAIQSSIMGIIVVTRYIST